MLIDKFRGLQSGVLQTLNLGRRLPAREKVRFNYLGICLNIGLVVTSMLSTYYTYVVLKAIGPAAAGLSAIILGMAGLSVARNSGYSHQHEDSALRKTARKFIVALVVVLACTDIIVYFSDRNAYISVYYILNVLGFIVVVLAFNNGLSPRVRTDLNVVAALLFAAFIVLVVYKIAEMMKYY